MRISLLLLITSCDTASGLGFGSSSFHRIHGSAKPIHHCKYVSRRMMSSRGFDDTNSEHSLQSDDTNNLNDGHDTSRRSLLHSVGLQFAGVVSSGPLGKLLRSMDVDESGVPTKSYGYVNAANAMGLVHFPCKPGELFNTYHLMRAGESGLEAEGVLSTNPLFLTNREDALTDLGTAQVEEVCNDLMSKGINPSVVKYSLAAKCIDAANIVANTMMVGRNRLVPEFTFMDPRGAGVWNGGPLASTEAAMWAMDVAEAGEQGRGAKPPENDDGTANDTLHDQFIRLRQLISILETQYSGDDILLIFPDGTSPALLSCLIAGIPLSNVHALNFMPGELRASVDMDNSKQLLEEKMASASYNEALSFGREELEKLRHEEKLKLIEKEKPRELLVKPVQSTQKELKKSTPSRFADKYEATDFDLGPDVFSAGAIGTMGYMGYMAVAPQKDEDESETAIGGKPAPVLAYADPTGSSVFDQQATTVSPSTTFAAVGTSATVSIPATATNVHDVDAGLFDPNVFEDVPVLTKNERIDAADKAMQEYLAQDDGGDDWLSSMTEMINEE